MKPEGDSYEKPVIVPHIWEVINREHHLVTEKVSVYIRELEESNLKMKTYILTRIVKRNKKRKNDTNNT